MYVSPLTERMRKRKAFADSELESKSHLFALPTSSSIDNLSSPYSRLTIPTMHLSGVIDYNTIQQSLITNESDSTDYLPPIPATPLLPSSSTMDSYRSCEYSCSEFSQQRIRIIDDAKLSNMNRQNNDSLIYGPSTNEANDNCTTTIATITTKPKLSFSIESIIGIKWCFP